MRPSLLRLAFIAVLCVCSACSTALVPYANDEDEGEDASATAAHSSHDGGAASSDAGPVLGSRDAGTSADGARDARARDSGARDVATRDASLHDAQVNALPGVDAGPLLPIDGGVSPCVPNNAPECPLRRPLDGTPCAVTQVDKACAYQVLAQPLYLDQLQCTDDPATADHSLRWLSTRVQCRHDCFKDIPHSFEEVDSSDCSMRPVTRCDQGFPNDQRAVDETLASIASVCGMTEYHLGLVFSRDGCARALFLREVKSPAIDCIGLHLSQLRFSCAPWCAAANAEAIK